MSTTPDSTSTPSGSHLRLLWPEWQGAAAGMVEDLVPEFPLGTARRGYAVGTRVLQAVLPPHDGPTATVPVPMDDAGTELRDGIESKTVLTRQLADALKIIKEQAPARITTLGGTCTVSVAPFTSLAERYGDDLAVVWIDSHPDLDTGDTDYDGYHAMAVSMITGHGDPEMTELLPATVPAGRVALVGLHDWTDDAYQHVEEWGLTAFSPDQLRGSTQPLLDWIASTGCSRVALHFDVDAIDSNEGSLGLGRIPDGLTGAEANRIAQDVQRATDVVATTVAEFVPRDVLHIQQILHGYPLSSS
ncbi:arginase family protein [Streptomyces reniochalinae]|uniref:Arginase family protein n=1 Tax=Streptomyces reniochalinae TaxID=2250578 RepID=A0A367E9A1_9ACTN|nr:arginase family protein [Streptomyces reniochalinae]RCG13820.1 arginase family protein [Streptomyces reniochalinae]